MNLLGCKLEVGEVTDGHGNASPHDAVIFFKGLHDSPEITVNAPNARAVAQRIVQLWNGARRANKSAAASHNRPSED